MSGQVLLARVVDGAGREVHHCPLPAPAPALICNGGHPSHSGYRTCWLTYNTHVFHSRLQPNQKSFILSAHDMSIHLLFTIHESRSQHHTPLLSALGLRMLHFIYQPFRNPFSNSIYLNSSRICRVDFMYIFN